MSSKRGLTKSFGYAFEGFTEAFKNEPNFKIHILAVLLVCVLSLFLNLSLTEWMILVIVVGQVIILELLNTAVEKIVDHISPIYSKNAKIAKDVSAAAVLTAAAVAVVIGIVLFVPKIILYLYF